MNKPETLELAKPAETTYFGVRIAFAQNLDRYARCVGAELFRESQDPARDSLPPVDHRRPLWYPQHPLLRKLADSPRLDRILESNSLRVRELEPPGNATRRRKINQTRAP